MLQTCAALAFGLALAACSSPADIRSAQAAVGQFHQALNAGGFDAIYDQSAPAMKAATPRDKFVKFLAAVHRKLGVAGATADQGFNVNYSTSGQFVTLTYATTYANGPAQESFVFRLDHGAASLVGYHINSDALIMN